MDEPKGVFTHGLIVIDPEEERESEGDGYTVLHFYGTWHEPTENDVDSLRYELMTDEEFELTDIADRVDIIPCPEEVLVQYQEMYKSELN